MGVRHVNDIRRYSDVLRSRRRDASTLRFVEARDADELQNHFVL